MLSESNLSFVKEDCVDCGKYIEGEKFERYERLGNYCETCDTKAKQRVYQRIRNSMNPNKRQLPEQYADAIERFFNTFVK